MQEVIEFSAHQMSVDHSSSFLVAGVLAFMWYRKNLEKTYF